MNGRTDQVTIITRNNKIRLQTNIINILMNK